MERGLRAARTACSKERPLFSQAIPARDSKAKIVNHLITEVKNVVYFIHQALLRLAMQLSRTMIHRIAKNCLEIREMLRTDNANV